MKKIIVLCAMLFTTSGAFAGKSRAPLTAAQKAKMTHLQALGEGRGYEKAILSAKPDAKVEMAPHLATKLGVAHLMRRNGSGDLEAKASDLQPQLATRMKERLDGGRALSKEIAKGEGRMSSAQRSKVAELRGTDRDTAYDEAISNAAPDAKITMPRSIAERIGMAHVMRSSADSTDLEGTAGDLQKALRDAKVQRHTAGRALRIEIAKGQNANE
jgi:hypothetical protein